MWIFFFFLAFHWGKASELACSESVWDRHAVPLRGCTSRGVSAQAPGRPRCRSERKSASAGFEKCAFHYWVCLKTWSSLY